MTAGLEILNLHAQGGMAEVYRARATDASGRTWYYAVKRMLPELLSNPDMMQMFIAEQRVAARLIHPNIVRVYDVAMGDAAAGQDTYIVMEFLEGKDLLAVIDGANERNRRLPVWFVVHVAIEVCKALHYAHHEATDKAGRPLGLIHRDISPHNIFICANGQVKLTDFGVARVDHADVRTRAGVIKGKFGYMSPEQLRSSPLDCRSDLYNVGILLFEALTGGRLFKGETATEFIAAMMRNEVPPLDPALGVPLELDALIRRALAGDRERRPATPQRFQEELAAIVERYGIAATAAHVAGELLAIFPDDALTIPPDSIGPASHRALDWSAEAMPRSNAGVVRPPASPRQAGDPHQAQGMAAQAEATDEFRQNLTDHARTAEPRSNVSTASEQGASRPVAPAVVRLGSGDDALASYDDAPTTKLTRPLLEELGIPVSPSPARAFEPGPRVPSPAPSEDSRRIARPGVQTRSSRVRALEEPSGGVTGKRGVTPVPVGSKDKGPVDE